MNKGKKSTTNVVEIKGNYHKVGAAVGMPEDSFECSTLSETRDQVSKDTARERFVLGVDEKEIVAKKLQTAFLQPQPGAEIKDRHYMQGDFGGTSFPRLTLQLYVQICSDTAPFYPLCALPKTYQTLAFAFLDDGRNLCSLNLSVLRLQGQNYWAMGFVRNLEAKELRDRQVSFFTNLPGYYLPTEGSEMQSFAHGESVSNVALVLNALLQSEKISQFLEPLFDTQNNPNLPFIMHWNAIISGFIANEGHLVVPIEGLSNLSVIDADTLTVPLSSQTEWERYQKQIDTWDTEEALAHATEKIKDKNGWLPMPTFFVRKKQSIEEQINALLDEFDNEVDYLKDAIPVAEAKVVSTALRAAMERFKKAQSNHQTIKNSCAHTIRTAMPKLNQHNTIKKILVNLLALFLLPVPTVLAWTYRACYTQSAFFSPNTRLGNCADALDHKIRALKLPKRQKS